MRKLVLILLMLLSFVASAEWLVYDYKATIKRLEPTFKPTKENGCNYTMRQVTDVISGYLVLKDCEVGDTICSEVGKGDLYVCRRGDKQYDKMVWRAGFDIQTSFFGNGFSTCKTYANLNDKISDTKRANRCTVMFDFDFLRPVAHDELAPVKNVDCEYAYGFLGWFNMDVKFVNTGFGSSEYKIVYPKYNICTYDEGGVCLRVKSANGMVTAKGDYVGNCGGATINSCNQFVVSTNPVSGTWTLKLNVAKSKSAPLSDELIESYVVGLFRASEFFDGSIED